MEGEGVVDLAQAMDSPEESALCAVSDPNENEPKAKKKKRKFAAWTHQEEQCFFNALRQVGKDFDKITARVHGKNKDQLHFFHYVKIISCLQAVIVCFGMQVRHYYYRLLRRINKLLGPGFSLDANNSKDSIAAMLRWWSLLQKFDCTTSKLHLKPRRYKIFVQIFGNELLEDRKRTERKCLPGDIKILFQTPILSKPQWSDYLSVKGISADARSSGRTADPEGASLKRMMEPDRNALSTAKQKRRSGTDVNLTKEKDLQPTAKLTLQLFPINEATRKALEKDEHNPHLELILSVRKKISVLEHLNHKWGSPNIESGELMLFPYSAVMEDLATCQRWTMKDNATIADVFLSVNSPSIFGLRYGWFYLVELQKGLSEINFAYIKDFMIQKDTNGKCNEHTFDDDCMPEQRPENPKDLSTLVCHMSSGMRRDVEDPDESINTHLLECRHKQVQSFHALPEEEWADSLTNIGVGNLLAEIPGGVASDIVGPVCDQNGMHNESSLDLFKSSIAFHVSSRQAEARPECVSHQTIWGAEEAYDEFHFVLETDSKQGSIKSTSGPRASTDHSKFEGFQGFLQDLAGAETAKDPPTIGVKSDVEETSTDSPRHINNDVVLKDCSLADIYWPDSLGSLDLEMPSLGPSSKHQAHDMEFSDSRNGWSCMMESSLDSFGTFFFQDSTWIPPADI
uniref:SANT domain-containing protein n=1 Tax=Oryza punctata TaxID=4537 RepID=A0A0E0M556_ORYPU